MISAESSPAVAPVSFWERESQRYNWMHIRLRLVLGEILKVAPTSLFELGCSMGALRAELLRRLPGLQYCACDVSQSAVAAIDDPNVLCLDLNRDPLPFADRTFDCIAGSGIIEYVADVPALLAGLRERLRPGGSLIVSYFNMHHVYRQMQRLRGRRPYRNPTWLNDYSLRQMRQLLRAAGFAVCDQIPTDLAWGRHRDLGQERWPEVALRRLRRVRLLDLFAHQAVFTARVRAAAAGAEAGAHKRSTPPCRA